MWRQDGRQWERIFDDEASARAFADDVTAHGNHLPPEWAGVTIPKGWFLRLAK